jgi:hypothetical protein
VQQRGAVFASLALPSDSRILSQQLLQR